MERVKVLLVEAGCCMMFIEEIKKLSNRERGIIALSISEQIYFSLEPLSESNWLSPVRSRI